MVEDLAQLDAAELAAAAADCVRSEMAAGCRLLEVAAYWADLHPGDGRSPADKINSGADERALVIAGDGTPDVAEGAPADLGLEIRLSPGQARALIADALDLRHRFPYIWRRILAGGIPAWQARWVAAKSRALTKAQAEAIDLKLAGHLGNVSKARLDNVLDAEMLRVDRESPERHAAKALRGRTVRFSPTGWNSVINVWATVPAGDAHHMDGSIDRLADILIARRDCLPSGVPARGAETRDEWRSVAVVLYTSNPILAARLLMEDQQAGIFERIDHQQIDQVVAEVVRTIDPGKLLPTENLHVHLSGDAFSNPDEHIARVEKIGPELLSTVRGWLGEACKIRLQPIIDVSSVVPVDRYEAPQRMRDALLARTTASIFPWSSSLNRHNDLDHTVPYEPPPSGPPGQTGLHNLGPLARDEHRARTFGRMSLRQPRPGTYVWRTKFGRVLITNDTGTHDLGDHDFAQCIWALADDPPGVAAAPAGPMDAPSSPQSIRPSNKSTAHLSDSGNGLPAANR
jgi:hypothetical protein